MKKVVIIMAALGGYAMLCAYGPSIPPPGANSPAGHVIGAVGGLLMCLPAVGFFMLFRSFAAWYRTFHARMVTDGFAGRRAGE